MGLEPSNGDNLARAQTNAEIDHPDQAVAEGGLAQGPASQRTSGFEPPDRESAHEVELDMIREERAMSGAVHLVSALAT